MMAAVNSFPCRWWPGPQGHRIIPGGALSQPFPTHLCDTCLQCNSIKAQEAGNKAGFTVLILPSILEVARRGTRSGDTAV